ncbi:MAG: FprA family A-type flavoprotein [Sulfolobales archaeon]|nr:FprA family A-type flavoprotein [Sulfolobales archaeon]MDW7969751.1 FprA family A-type flavoprotein [Sulfolobales archaeon]
MTINTYEFRKGIYMISVNDLRTRLFESLWDIPEGIAYNAYLIIDERTVLIDGVKGIYSEVLIGEVKKLLGGRGLDYYVVHHGEPDHSGSFPKLIKEYPNVKVITTEVGFKIIRSLYPVSFNHITVSDGYELIIGNRKLKFFQTPWLHWPDTFMTYLYGDKILFSGDAFGSYGALTNGLWDKDYGDLHLSLSKRYFANIVAAFRSHVPKAINKLSGYEIDLIAPAHGPLVGKVSDAVNTYLRWSKPELERKVLIIYGSMYGNLEEAVKHVAKGVEEVDVDAVVMKVPDTPITYLVRELFDSPAIVLGIPTYDGSAFPYISLVLNLMKIKRFEGRYVGIVSSGLWSAVAESKVMKDLDEVKATVDGKVSILGHPKGDDITKLVDLGRSLGRRAAEVVSKQ